MLRWIGGKAACLLLQAPEGERALRGCLKVARCVDGCSELISIPWLTKGSGIVSTGAKILVRLSGYYGWCFYLLGTVVPKCPV